MNKPVGRPSGQFRFGYFTPIYDGTVAFYRDGLGWPVLESWDRGRDDRGTIVGAASGMVEILARPEGDAPEHLWDRRPPQGAFMVIEVPDADACYRRAVSQALPITHTLTNQSWGHRSFCVTEPNGLTIYLFHQI